MSKFKGGGQGARQDREKILKQRAIHFQVRRKLKQHRSQSSGSRQRRNCGEKSRHEIVGPFESLDMRDHLMRLDSKAKVRRRILQPVLHGRLFYKLPEGEIHFDGIELSRIVSKEFLLRQFGWIKFGLPCRVSPSGGANVKL